MTHISRNLERVYKFVGWIEDPSREETQARYRRLIEHFSRILEHEWMREILDKGAIRILDLCGGTGIGGIAFSKAVDSKAEIELCIADLRESVLKIAEEWSREELGVSARTLVIDAKRIHELREVFDVVLITGFSLPHFCPWDVLELFAAVTEILPDKGILVLEENDRRYSIFLRAGYRSVLVEKAENNSVVLSVHSRYDPVRGTIQRVHFDFLKNEACIIDTFFWGLSELMGFLWVFFRDIDIVWVTRTYGFILAREPRRKLSIKDFEKKPRVLAMTRQIP